MELKTIAAEAFGIAEADVTDAHLKMVSDIAAKAAPTPEPKLDLSANQIKDLQEQVLDLQRKAAEVNRPAVDPAEADRDTAILAKTKSLPDITTAVLDDEEGEADVKAFRKQWDLLHTLAVALGDKHGPRPVQKLDYWKKLEARYPDFTKAVDTATQYGGAEWAPTLYSTDMQQSVYDNTVVAALFPRIRAPKQSWVLPFSPTGGTVYLAGEATSDSAADYTSTTPASRNKTITSKKLICRIPWSEEFDEESIVAAAPLFQAHAARLMAEAIDSAIVNGDTTGTHQDTGKSYTSTSAEAAWDGLRDIAMNGMSNTKDLSTFTGDNILALIAQMGDKYTQNPADLVILTPSKIRGKWFTMIDNATNKNPVFQRSTPMGDELVRMGALMDFYGTPVVPSFAVWSDVNTSGIYDGSTKTDSVIVICHKPSFLLTDRKELSLIGYDQPLKGLQNIIANWRGSFDALQPLTDDYCAVGYSITTA